MIAILSWHLFLVGPEILQESTQAMSRAVSFLGLDEALPVNGVVCLPDFKEDHE